MIPDHYFRDLGDQLGSGERPRYMNGLPHEEFERYVKLSKVNDIPWHVFQNRVWKGTHPQRAATMPYRKKRG